MQPSSGAQNGINAGTFSTMMRGVYRAAIAQGWLIRKTASGHFKFIPPKGQFVLISNTDAAFKPNVNKLEAAGLILGDKQVKERKVETPVEDKKEVVAVMTLPPVVQTVEALASAAPLRGQLQETIVRILGADPARLWTKDEIFEGVGKEGISTTVDSIVTSLSTLVVKGSLVRAGRGVYRVYKEGARVNGAALGGPLPDDDAIIDQFLDSLSALQALAGRMRQRSAKFNELMKLMGSADV